MKRYLLIMMAAVMFLCSGCDFMRTLAGRPTSRDIEDRKLEILRAQEALEQARLDSLRRMQQAVRDSIAALDSIRQQGGTILNPARLGGLFTTKLESRYYVIVGSFRQRANAETLLRKAADSGYRPALICFRNGMIAVGVSPVNTVPEALKAMKAVKEESFCPSDVWILVNE